MNSNFFFPLYSSSLIGWNDVLFVPRIVFIQIATCYRINIDPPLFAEYRIKSSSKSVRKNATSIVLRKRITRWNCIFYF